MGDANALCAAAGNTVRSSPPEYPLAVMLAARKFSTFISGEEKKTLPQQPGAGAGMTFFVKQPLQRRGPRRGTPEAGCLKRKTI